MRRNLKSRVFPIYLLDGVYRRSAELIEDNQNVSEGLKRHLGQILPCIAFYEALLEKEGSREKALVVFESWCFGKIEKMAGMLPKLMKIPGLYKKMPALMNKMLDKMFGEKCGFQYETVNQENGFAANMHPKLVWGRTKTLGTGGDCCDFSLYIKPEK